MPNYKQIGMSKCPNCGFPAPIHGEGEIRECSYCHNKMVAKLISSKISCGLIFGLAVVAVTGVIILSKRSK